MTVIRRPIVPSVLWAKPEDYKKAVLRVHHAPGPATFIELPLVDDHKM